jgi:integrase
VRRDAAVIGLDPLGYGAHSLRASFVTAAADRGADPLAIMQVTGHRNVATVAAYVRPDVFAFKQTRAL